MHSQITTGMGYADMTEIVCDRRTTTDASFAELVEYCWGNVTTPMGAKRKADGHPLPYKIRFFELGNEGSGKLIDRRST